MISAPVREGIGVRPCPLCGAVAMRVFAGHPGYREPARYDIYGCESCDTRFADPLATDDGIYDLVYRNIEHVRGYARYARYARTVRHRADPLAYLADEEDSYWAVAEFLKVQPRDAGPLIEVGSGLGYLTYAISRRGYDIRGLDISSVAVRDAKRRFGDLYVCGDLHAFARERAGRYAAVILTEVIEHVAEPEALLASALALVRPGGAVVVTTPNRSASPPHVLWDTDSPPVHLWWFSETSVRTLADQLGVSVHFVDFTAYNRTHPNDIDDRFEMARPSVPPAFDAAGRLLEPPNPLKALFRRAFFAFGIDRIRRAAEKRQAASQLPSPRRKSLCATFHRAP